MKSLHKPNAVRWLAVVSLAFAVTGCLQIDTRVKLHENGSATITERVRFSKRLLEFGSKEQPDLNIASLLEKPVVLERMKHMGKGITLVSHKVRDAEKGSRECLSVFRIPAVENFRYVSPYIGKADYAKQKGLACKIYPLLSNSWTGRRAGYMEIDFVSASKGQRGGTYKGISPADRQVFRRLKPLFQDMLRDFELKLVFESYAPVVVHRAGQRNRGTRTHEAHLIHVSGENLDRYGARFIDNEEAMADLLQVAINGPHVRANCGFGSTSQLFRFENGGCGIMFRPSKDHFDKYFAGKTLNFGKGVKRKADFKKDGYRPELSEEHNRKKKGK